MDYKNILVATDGSSLMAKVYEHAIYLAQLLGATLHVVYVLDIVGLSAYPVDSSWESMYEILRVEGDEITQNAKRMFVGEGVEEGNVQIAVLEGHPAEEINKYTDQHNIDLVIIGTHGRRGLDRVLIGSIADKVIRTAKVPVLVIRGG